MVDMQIIPVLDILGYPNPIAVQALRGERSKYGPLSSVLCDSSNPVELAINIEREFGSSVIYIADLDGILHKTINWTIIDEIRSKTELQLYLDTGIQTITDLYNVIDHGINYPIIASETMSDHKEILEGLNSLSSDQKVVISIDLWKGQIMSKDPIISGMPLQSILTVFDYKQVMGFIILELTQVGTQLGVSLSPLHETITQTTKQIITGGGIKNLEGLLELKSFGVYGILVGTAIHNGQLTRDMIMSIQKS